MKELHSALAGVIFVLGSALAVFEETVCLLLPIRAVLPAATSLPPTAAGSDRNYLL